jgi:pyridoxamine 5'-phosphate oxidase
MGSQPLGDRSNYQRGRLDASDLLPDPVDQFHRWVNEAIAAQVPEPLAAALATADESGNPSVRMILIRGIGPAGIDFYTNHGSRKGRDLAARPAAALTLWWPTLERQVRLSGSVTRLSEAESAAYFASRPLESQLGAWASAQGEPIADRAALEAALSAATANHAPTPESLPALPPHWGGYRVTPAHWEFWQGGEHRLHDRFEYLRATPNGSWETRRLQP